MDHLLQLCSLCCRRARSEGFELGHWSLTSDIGFRVVEGDRYSRSPRGLAKSGAAARIQLRFGSKLYFRVLGGLVPRYNRGLEAFRAKRTGKDTSTTVHYTLPLV